MKPTAEDLIVAIRNANSLVELKRMVGPSEEDREAAKQRLATLDAINDSCEWHSMCPSYSAEQARARWYTIMEVQGMFESLYC